MDITNENFKDILAEGKPVVIDFWAPWCGPCRMVGPIIEELATEYEGKVIVGKCNIDECDELTTEFGIRNIPTVLFFKDGQVVDKQVGATGKPKFVEKINSIL
ncbi:MAG: thioredoxin [Mediterranea sp.]|jgi:thioredoxin 1|nr:thioredoxin [Mediterranea sp.]